MVTDLTSVPELAKIMVTSDLSTQLMVAVMPSCSSSGHVTVILRQRLLLSGDVELNPGPLDQGSLLLLLFSITKSSYCVLYRRSGNFRVKKLSYDKFLCKKIFIGMIPYCIIVNSVR